MSIAHFSSLFQISCFTPLLFGYLANPKKSPTELMYVPGFDLMQLTIGNESSRVTAVQF